MQLHTDAGPTTSIRLRAVTAPRLTSERILLLALLGVIFLLRIIPLHYNTLFIDDAIYATLGHDILRHDFSQGASKWIFGSYAYPVLSALADSVGGEVGIRVLGALLGLLSSFFVYLSTQRLFGTAAGLWGLFFFGLSGCSVALGQQSVIDSLSVPFLALSLFCLVLAYQPGTRRKRLLFAAGLALSVSMLAKYISLLYLPALVGLFIAFNLREGRGLRAIVADMQWVYLAVPVIVLFGGYAAIYYSDLLEVLTGDYSRQIVSRGEVANTIIEELGVLFLMALLGLFFVIRTTQRTYELSLKKGFLLLGGVVLLFASFLTLPAYHLASSNIRSISKHDVYVLVFLAPLAGYALAATAEWLTGEMHPITPLRQVVQVGGTVVTIVLALGFIGQSQQQIRTFHRSWPNAASTVDYLKTLDIGPRNTVLASASAIYEYYLDLGPASREVWSNMWYLEYQGLTGKDALTTAVGVCTFDVVITDDFYSPEVNWYLEPLLADTGYKLAYSTREDIGSSSSKVSIRVYVPSNSGECAVRFNASPGNS